MEDLKPSDVNGGQDVQRNYLKAFRFAWMVMVVLAFAGSLIAELVLYNLAASIMLGALSIIGMISQELYLTWIFRGTPPPVDGRGSRSTWRGTVLRVLFVMLVLVIPDISEDQLSVRSFIFAAVSGGCLALFFWWEGSRAVPRNDPAQSAM